MRNHRLVMAQAPIAKTTTARVFEYLDSQAHGFLSTSARVFEYRNSQVHGFLSTSARVFEYRNARKSATLLSFSTSKDNVKDNG